MPRSIMTRRAGMARDFGRWLAFLMVGVFVGRSWPGHPLIWPAMLAVVLLINRLVPSSELIRVQAELDALEAQLAALDDEERTT